VEVDKGTVVRALADGLAVVAVAGDDVGDVAAFDAATDLVADRSLVAAVRVGVASSEAPPAVLAADVVVEGPGGLAMLLDAVADAIRRRPRGR
jgi:trehalose 6-phosphate phosphatase